MATANKIRMTMQQINKSKQNKRKERNVCDETAPITIPFPIPCRSSATVMSLPP